MGSSDPRTRHLRRLPDAAVRVESAPSRTAQDRLTEALRDRAEAYRTDATVDLTLVDVLVRMDQLEAAARTLDDHRASLHAMAQDLQVVVADAAVEREAERVYDTCLRQLRPGALHVAGLRRRLLALTGAAAVFVALLLPSTRISPRTMLASIEDGVTHDEIAEARSRLDAARSTAAAVRAEVQEAPPVAPEALDDPAVRKQVRALLSADAPEEPAAAAPEGVTMLAKVRAVRDRARPASRRDDTDDERDGRVVPFRVRDSNAAGEAVDALVPAPQDDGAPSPEDPADSAGTHTSGD